MSTPAEYFDLAELAAEIPDWPLAAHALATGVQLDADAPARHYAALAAARDQLQDLAGAEEAYREAISRRRRSPAAWYLKLARLLERQDRWADAVEVYQQLITSGNDPQTRWFFQLGRAYEKLGRLQQAGDAYARGLEVDADAREVDRRMLAKEPQEFPGRRKLLRFVEQHLDEIRSRAEESLATGQDRTGVIYSYWAQGVEHAPEIVRLCHRRLTRHAGDAVLVLNEPAMQKLIKLPAEIEELGIAPTHRSDLLRLELLARYGGTWMDATCLVAGDPRPRLAELREPSGWFAFAKRNTTLATWLMTSTPDHDLVRLLRAALHCYWMHHDRLTHYFALHYIFEALTELDERFRELWDSTPRIGFSDPFQIRWHLTDPYDPERFEEMINGCFVHKLTYKYAPGDVRPGTVLEHVLQLD